MVPSMLELIFFYVLQNIIQGYNREQRNHGLKYESDCVHIGIGIKIFMNCVRFCKRSFC